MNLHKVGAIIERGPLRGVAVIRPNRIGYFFDENCAQILKMPGLSRPSDHAWDGYRTFTCWSSPRRETWKRLEPTVGFQRRFSLSPPTLDQGSFECRSPFRRQPSLWRPRQTSWTVGQHRHFHLEEGKKEKLLIDELTHILVVKSSWDCPRWTSVIFVFNSLGDLGSPTNYNNL